jgi:hypothetical protein
VDRIEERLQRFFPYDLYLPGAMPQTYDETTPLALKMQLRALARAA